MNKMIVFAALLSVVLAACGSTQAPPASSVNYTLEQWEELTTTNMQPVDIFQYTARFLSETNRFMDKEEIENDRQYIGQMNAIMNEAPEHVTHDPALNTYVSRYNGLPVGLVDMDSGQLIEPNHIYDIASLVPVNPYTCRAELLSLYCRDSADNDVNAKQVGDNALGNKLLKASNFHVIALLRERGNSIRCYGSICFLDNDGYIIGTLQDTLAWRINTGCRRRAGAVVIC